MSWRELIPRRDRELSARSGRGRRLAPGARPALIVIDVTYGFTGRDRGPIEAAIAEYPNACGEPAWRAVDAIRPVLAEVRRQGLPVLHTAGVSDAGATLGGRANEKHGRRAAQPADAAQIVEELAPVSGEVVIRKARPSAFFGTPLISALIDARVDTLLVAGCTTSGCVRATVVDAFSFGLRTLVVEDGVFDRVELSHAVNLFDIDQKYGDVRQAADVLDYLANLPKEQR
jgi:nicotinamidase-related amidase